MLAMWTPGALELTIILVIVILLFGVGKLPQAAKELGSGIRSFQRSLRGDEEDGEDEDDEAEPKKLDKQAEQDDASAATTAARKEERVSS